MLVWTIEDSTGRPFGVAESEEAATSILHRLRAARPDAAEFRVRSWHVMDAEVEPLVALTIQARIADIGEVFVTSEQRESIWPTRPDLSVSEAAWIWRRSEGHAYGVLAVRGVSEEQVRTLFQIVSEAYRTDENMRSQKYFEHNWHVWEGNY
jgi:hypothetical protein